MSDTKKSLEKVLFSTIGVIGALVILVSLNIVFSKVRVRGDVTQDRVNTLSPGTKTILKKLDTDVVIRFYYTQSDNAMPVFLRNYAERVQTLLDSYRQNGNGHIRVEILDPQPDSDAEDSANLDGIPAQPIEMDTSIYFGISFACVDKKATIPFLLPDREPLLEYDISSKITEVTTVNKPVIGILSGLEVFGSQGMPPQYGGQGSKPEWIFVENLKTKYDVRKVEKTAEEIPAEIATLVVAHPTELKDRTLYAIDQFVLRGGKLLVLVDPLSAYTTFSQPQNPMMMGMPQPGNASDLPKLLPNWGIEFVGNQVVADRVFSSTMGGQGGAPQVMPAVLSVTSEGVNKDDVVTGQIDNLMVPFAGQLKVKAPEGVKSEVLLHTTKQSQLIDTFAAQNGGQKILTDFAPSGEEMTLGVRLTGKFKTAFPDGQPAAAPPAEGEQPKPEEPKSTAAPLKESTQPTSIIVVGDTDILYDEFSVRVQNIFGQRVMIPMNANIDLVLNMIDQLAGDSNLIGIRSRGTVNRPFTRIQEMEAAAQDQFREKLAGLEKELQDASTRLNELQVNKEPGQKFILSPEQQQEIEKFQKREGEVKKELKQVRRDLRRDTDKLRLFLTLMNIFAMPLVVVAAGIGVAIGHRRMQKASQS
jgi:ABC-type uncharacterized transport system involved in gliding motility auxiliary subunit